MTLVPIARPASSRVLPAVLPSAPFVDAPPLEIADFRRVADLAKRVAGLELPPGKEGLVRARLARRLRALDLPSFAAYLDRVEADATHAELRELVDALTTNKTSFFREPRHFDHIAAVLPERAAAERRGVRLWSAGCSSGEEPYSLAMLLHERLPGPLAAQSRILATDISARVLAHATAARYAGGALGGVSEERRRRHLVPDADGGWAIAPAVRDLVRFARLNLIGAWPMRGPFDAILCRNVMIYFDRPTQARLVERFAALLAPGGHLIVGHAESLGGIEHGLAYVQPSVYARPLVARSA